MSKTVSAAYFRTQAERCNRLSRNCMDLGTARDLRVMAEEYLGQAASVEQAERYGASDAMSHQGETQQDNVVHQDRPAPLMQQRQNQPRMRRN